MPISKRVQEKLNKEFPRKEYFKNYSFERRCKIITEELEFPDVLDTTIGGNPNQRRSSVSSLGSDPDKHRSYAIRVDKDSRKRIEKKINRLFVPDYHKKPFTITSFRKWKPYKEWREKNLKNK